MLRALKRLDFYLIFILASNETRHNILDEIEI